MALTFEIISVGHELLNGNTLNSNAHWMMGKISEIGGIMRRCTIVGDNVDEIVAAVKEALARKTSWIISSGGLGPTYDDITLESVAKALNRTLVPNDKAIRMLKRRYSSRNIENDVKKIEFTSSRLKMATLPEGAEPLTNPVGSAPGVHIISDTSSIFCLPGVPNEMKEIFEKSVIRIVKASEHTKNRQMTVLRLVHGYESSLAPFLEKIVKRYPDVYIKSHPRGVCDGVSKIEIQFLAIADTKTSARRISKRAASELKNLILDSDKGFEIEEILEG